jgi:DNA-binding CsgD family transcriptional regulator
MTLPSGVEHDASDAMLAALAVARGALPDASFAPAALIDRVRLLTTRWMTEMVPVEQRLLAASGMLIARVSAGERERAEDLGGYLIGKAPELEAHSSAFDRSLFWSALSEVAITQGAAREAAALAYRAQQAAVVSGDAAAGYRAAMLVCVSTAVNGEYAAADAASALANAIAEEHGWDITPGSYALLVGELFLASADLRADTLEKLSYEFGRYPDDPRFASTATVVAGMSALARGDAAGAIAAAHPAVGGMADERVLPMVRGFALGIIADAHLLRGEPLRTLALLEGVDSNREHTLCFDMQRASAYLTLGEPLKALQTTRACVAMGARHCIRTRGPILFRRALAHRALGHDDVAEAEFEDAVTAVIASGSLTPLLTLPKTDLGRFVDAYRRRRPELSETLDAFMVNLGRVPAISPRRGVALPALTRREQDLAWRLQGDVSIAELARQAFVSPNTVKTHLRRLYAKLGVSSREQAVATLERGGFFERITPAQGAGAASAVPQKPSS